MCLNSIVATLGSNMDSESKIICDKSQRYEIKFDQQTTALEFLFWLKYFFDLWFFWPKHLFNLPFFYQNLFGLPKPNFHIFTFLPLKKSLRTKNKLDWKIIEIWNNPKIFLAKIFLWTPIFFQSEILLNFWNQKCVQSLNLK